jgi:hypothetical protein
MPGPGSQQNRQLTLLVEAAYPLHLLDRLRYLERVAELLRPSRGQDGSLLAPEPPGPLPHLFRASVSYFSKRPTNPALAVHCRAWEVCSVIGKLVSTHDDGYGFGWPGASAEMDDL